MHSNAQTLGFQHRKVTPRWSRANGEVERFLRMVKKVIKTENLERKSWKQEMYRFLRNFRATPQTTTRIPPVTALFNRAIKTKLPEFNEGQQASTLEANDRRAKKKIKTYADVKAYVRLSEIKEGDTVFVRRDDTKRKRDTPYRPEPYVVIVHPLPVTHRTRQSARYVQQKRSNRRNLITIPLINSSPT